MNTVRFFTHPTHDGIPQKWCWIIFAGFGYSLQWHRHSKCCRYGFYFGRRGLIFAANIPLLGDFSIWR